MGGIRAHGYTRGRRFDCTSRMTDQLTDKSPADVARHHAFVFPGQGSQYVGMGSALLERSPEAQAIMERADAALGSRSAASIAEGPADGAGPDHQRPAGNPGHQHRLPGGASRRRPPRGNRAAAPAAGRPLGRAVRRGGGRRCDRLRDRHAAGSGARPDHAGARHRWRHGRRHRPDRRAGARDRGPGQRAWRDRRGQSATPGQIVLSGSSRHWSSPWR